MQDNLIVLNGGLQNIKEYICCLDIEARLLAHDPNTENCASAQLVRDYAQYRSYIIQKRRFCYNTIIISLYGYFEAFIEGLIEAYVDRLNKITPKYEYLPEEIVKKHLNLSLDILIHRIKTNKIDEKFEDSIISNLHSCIKDAVSFRLNAVAFSHHTANYRFSTIESSFADVGICQMSGKVKEHDSFVNCIKEMELGKKEFQILEDLVERRNQVSHGASSDILSNEILLQYVKYIEALGEALSSVTRSQSLLLETKFCGIELGKPFHIFNGNIACLRVSNVELRVGDRVIVVNADQKGAFESEILEMQMNRVAYDIIMASSSTEIAVRFPFKPSTGQIFYLKLRENAQLAQQLTFDFSIEDMPEKVEESREENDYDPLNENYFSDDYDYRAEHENDDS